MKTIGKILLTILVVLGVLLILSEPQEYLVNTNYFTILTISKLLGVVCIVISYAIYKKTLK